jgi:hypothetical protein
MYTHHMRTRHFTTRTCKHAIAQVRGYLDVYLHAPCSYYQKLAGQNIKNKHKTYSHYSSDLASTLRFVIVTDDIVSDLYANTLLQGFQLLGYGYVTIHSIYKVFACNAHIHTRTYTRAHTTRTYNAHIHMRTYTRHALIHTRTYTRTHTHAHIHTRTEQCWRWFPQGSSPSQERWRPKLRTTWLPWRLNKHVSSRMRATVSTKPRAILVFGTFFSVWISLENYP